MTSGPPPMRQALEFDPGLVAGAVLDGVARLGPEVRRRFHHEREACYHSRDPEERATLFQDLDTRWFARLGFARTLERLLGEQPDVARAGIRWRVVRARDAGDEGADLHSGALVPVPCRRLGLIRLRVSTLLDAEVLSRLLRHELGHAADMLDPEYGYDPDLEPPVADPTLERLIRARYHAAWDVCVDGRLAARGLAPPGIEEARRRAFEAAFAGLGARARTQFDRLFRSPQPRHRELVALAREPGATGAADTAGGHCPLCGALGMPDPACGLGLDPHAVAEIARDFPGWTRADGLCRHCADIYSTRR